MASGQVALVTAAAGGTGQFAVQVSNCYVHIFIQKPEFLALLQTFSFS